MSCKYCELKMRPINDDTEVLKGESWGEEHGEGGYIGQMYDDKFRMLVSYDAGYACTAVDDIKYCPFCGTELTMPKGPLIKDEKIRKAVRAWADVNGIDDIVAHILEDGIEFAGNATMLNIRFVQSLVIDTDRRYTIAELCGEEEE